MDVEKIELIGLALPFKTTNENGQSTTDCGNLWQKFENEKFLEKITERLSDEIFAVYHNYEGNQTKLFSYFIGCKVKPGALVPKGMNTFTIMNGRYHKATA